MDNIASSPASSTRGAISKIYQPLDPATRQIRILHVDEQRDSHGRVVCSLQTVSLCNDPPPIYEAVSWCWGDTSKKALIELNGQNFEVTQNAEEVLSRLCVDHQHYVVWMDAVCINQNDVEERNKQVAMMDDVYAKAEQTIVWLGEEDDMTEDAFQILETFTNHIRDNIDRGEDQLLKLELPISMSRSWSAVKPLLLRPWFSRLWVMQEVALAKNVTLYLGRYSIPGRCLRDNIELLIWKGDESSLDIRDEISISELTITWISYPSPLSLPLSSLLSMSCFGHGVSNPRDRIYALLGVMRRAQLSGASPAGGFPDYEKPLEIVYTAATRDCIQNDLMQARPEPLFLLNYVPYFLPATTEAERLSQLPSWVPPFNRPFDKKYLTPVFPAISVDHEIAPGILGMNRTDKSTHTQPQSSDIENQATLKQLSVLSVQGLLVDRILGNVSIFEGRPPAGMRPSNVYVTWCKLRAEVWPDRLQALKTKFAHTLLENAHINHKDSSDGCRHMKDFQAFIDACDEIANLSRGDEPRIHEQIDNLISMQYMQLICESARYMTLIITNGHLLGTAFPHTQPGDAVVILFGSSTSIVLRPEGDHWIFIGHAYVYELVHGKYIKGLIDEGKLEEQKRYFDIH